MGGASQGPTAETQAHNLLRPDREPWTGRRKQSPAVRETVRGLGPQGEKPEKQVAPEWDRETITGPED